MGRVAHGDAVVGVALMNLLDLATMTRGMGRRDVRRRRSSLERLETRTLLTGTPLLPDLIPWSDEHLGLMYDWDVEAETDGRTLLRLSTSTANIGAGPLELNGGAIHENGTQDVWQRIEYSDGGHEVRLAGEFEYHPEHDHVHFAGFAEYNLRAVTSEDGVGDVVATGGKTSFCVLDLQDYDLTLPQAPSEPQFVGCDTSQGLSVGWADIYDRELPDQWIDVTGVPAGEYWLEVVVDPENRLLEGDDSNNTASILIDLQAPQPLEPDVYEPNDSEATAVNLGAGPVQMEHLSIHASDNEDWYAWTATSERTVDIIVNFRDAAGDIDLFIYDATGQEIDSSQGVDNFEAVTVTLAAGEMIFVQVIGFDGAVNADYALTIDAGGAFTLPDAQEVNDSFAAATHLDPLVQTIADLNLHSKTDQDFFRWTSPTSGRLNVQSLFEPQGNAAIEAYDMLHTLIGASTSEPGLAELAIDVVHGQLLYFRVANPDAMSLPYYELSIALAPLLPGDTDHNGRVDVTDLNAVRNNFGADGTHLSGDADFDGDVDVSDLNAIRNNFGRSLAGEMMANVGQYAAPLNHDYLARDVLASIPVATELRRSNFFYRRAIIAAP